MKLALENVEFDVVGEDINILSSDFIKKKVKCHSTWLMYCGYYLRFQVNSFIIEQW